MDTVFPFGFPGPTAFYLTLYVVTLVVHVLFMNYVLAGTAYLLIASLRGRPKEPSQPTDEHAVSSYPPTVSGVLRDWLPAMLSGAITAGVAPLLFLQILYQQEFYTSNLLLFNRWMTILPVLIVGFYALYVVRTDWIASRPAWLRILAAAVPFACVAFVAYSWTENHLLSVAGSQTWQNFYLSDHILYYTPAIVPRLMVWAFGSLPTMCMWLGWQLWYRSRRGADVPPAENRRVAGLALLGLLLALAGGAWYHEASPAKVRALLSGDIAKPYFLLAAIGLVVQGVAWTQQWLTKKFDFRWLTLATVGLLFTVLGMTVCREVVRLDALGPARLDELYPLHAAAARVEGFPVFLAFAAVNATLIAVCFLVVRKSRLPSPHAKSH